MWWVCWVRSRRSLPSPETSHRPGWMSPLWRSCAVSRERASWMSMAATTDCGPASCDAFQRLGYDETTLEIFDEALRKGDLLLQVPAQPAERLRVAGLLQRHHVHDVGYFAPGTFEQFPILDAD